MRAPSPRCEPTRAAARRSSCTRDPARRRGGHRRWRRRARDRAHARHRNRHRDRHRYRRQRGHSRLHGRREPPDSNSGPPARTHGRTSWSRSRRSTAATPPSPVPNRLAGRDCDASACSIRRATQASIRATGWSSPGSIRASPRPRAACARRRRCRRVRAPSASPVDARHPFVAQLGNFKGEFVTQAQTG